MPTPSTGTQRLRDDDLPGYEATTRTESLFDHLMWQLRVSDFTEQEERVAVILIGNVRPRVSQGKDEDGHVVDSNSIISMVCRETGNDYE